MQRTVQRTILLADDVATFREVGALFLARSARVVTAETCEQALALAKRERPDLILTSLRMPGMSGDELCRSIKADPNLAQTPVIVLLGANDGEARARAVRAGADDLLVKPLNRAGLTEAINRFLRWPEVRGLPRIECSVRVGVDRGVDVGVALGVDLRVNSQPVTTWCTARNLSRGGLFVETAQPAALENEVRLRFALPELPHEFSPTAQVVWRSPHDSSEQLAGMGLRFLEIDSDAEKQLDDYIFHHRFVRELPQTGVLP